MRPSAVNGSLPASDVFRAVASGTSRAINGARAALILGLIVFHTARVFDPSNFYVKAPVQIDAVAPLILFGVVWGMPLFFLIAGYAVWHSLNARGAGELVSERVKRVLLPFVAGVVLLVPPQIYIERHLTGDRVDYLGSLKQFLDVHLTPQFPLPVTGPWFETGHLWFLGYLFVFTLVLLPALLLLKRRSNAGEFLARHTAAVWVSAMTAVAAMEALLGTEANGGWNRWTFLVFLALGALLAIQPRLGEPMARRPGRLAVIALIAFAALVATGEQLDHRLGVQLATGSSLDPTLWRAGKGITGVLFMMAIVGSLAAYGARSSSPGGGRTWTAAFTSYIGQISLPLYMLHQTVIVVLAYLILQLDLFPPLQWLMLVVLTVTVAVSTVEVASRTRIGRMFFGMRPRRHGPSPTPPLPHREAPAPEPELVPSTVV
jgi:glucans biosynthesis protein C